jgi:hypothetical protein
LTAPLPGAVWVRQASLSSASIENAKPGQTVKVPVYVQVQDGSTLSGLQFLAKVTPAPENNTPAQFILADGIPAGRTVDNLAPSQIAYAWDLNSFKSPLSGKVLLGYAQFTVPPSAHAGQVYRLRFANADGAPDANTQFDFETFAGAVWVGTPAAPTQDKISDDWKIKFFGSVDSPLADPSADPDHDGSTNLQEYLAGTNPIDPQSHLHLYIPQAKWSKGHKQLSLNWLSAPGKTYVIETTSDVVNGPWTTVASGVLGDGTLKEYLASNTLDSTQYYRVRLQN